MTSRGWLLLLALAPALAPAQSGPEECLCVWRGSFTDVQGDTALVVSGQVTRHKGNSIDLSNDRIYRGTEHGDEIRIWLKAGSWCRPEVSEFPDGSHWIMALNRIDDVPQGGFNPNTPNVSYGRVGDYILSSCGGYWLSREGDWVTGNLVQAPRWERNPKMTPVLMELVAEFIAGDLSATALLEASKEDPALRELRLDTRAFLRGQGEGEE